MLKFPSIKIDPVHAESSMLMVFAEAASFARLDDVDPSGWFYQAVLYNPTNTSIVVDGLRWRYNGTAKFVEAGRNARCYDKRYFTALPTTSFLSDRAIYWEYAVGSISITVPPKKVIITWIEVPTRSINDETISTLYTVEAHVDSQWLSSPSYPAHSGQDAVTTTLFRADFNLTTSPNSENQTHPNPQWLYNEDRYVIANISIRIRLIPVTTSRNSPGIGTATINITFPANWHYVAGSAYNPYDETITSYITAGKDKLKWELTNPITRYATNQSMNQNYIEFNVTAPYSPGVYNFTVNARITSQSAKTTTENQNIYVVVKTPPTAIFTSSPKTALTVQSVSFNASASFDPDGQVASYFWEFGDGANDTGKTTTHAYADNGDYTVKLTVTDNEGMRNTALDLITILNRPPVAEFAESAETVLTGTIIQFNASRSYDIDGTVISYFWDFGDLTNSTGITADHAYQDDGNYIVTLTVTDNDGASVSVNATVIILNTAPVASFSSSPSQPIAGGPVTFDASGSYDPDGTLMNYTWNFGDENITTTGESAIIHVYSQAADFNVTLTVIDNDGRSALTWQLISVYIHDVAVINVTVSQTEAHIGGTITISVTVKNKGTMAESFNVSVFRNSTEIATQQVLDLPSGAERVLVFYWNTSSVPDTTKFLIQARASAVPYESDTTDNDYADGSVNIIRAQDNGFSLWPPSGWSWLLFAIPPLVLLIIGATRKKRNAHEKFKDIKYLDEITDGPIPDGFSVLVSGEAGSGKSVLCQELTYRYLDMEKPCVYATYDCFPDEIRSNIEKFHGRLSEHETAGRFTFIDCYSSIAKVESKEKYFLSQPFSLADLGIMISKVTSEVGAPLRVFLDSIVPLLTHVEPQKVVEFLQDRSARIKGADGTFIFTVGKETIESSLISRLEEVVDCVIELDVITSKGKKVRRLRVKKMRGRKPLEKWVPFRIDPAKGIVFLA